MPTLITSNTFNYNRNIIGAKPIFNGYLQIYQKC